MDVGVAANGAVIGEAAATKAKEAKATRRKAPSRRPPKARSESSADPRHSTKMNDTLPGDFQREMAKNWKTNKSQKANLAVACPDREDSNEMNDGREDD